ncbi:MAG: TerC family protein [Geminicoccaceae bacterium]
MWQLAELQFDPASLAMVVFIDLVLSGDNAVVIGLAAAALPTAQRNLAICWGIGIAIAMRVIFALGTVQLMGLTGIKLFGGLLLLWVCFRLWQDLAGGHTDGAGVVSVSSDGQAAVAARSGVASPSLMRAMTSIVIADLSMSLDNVLAVAGVARDNMLTLVFGLGLSILLMAVAATAIARTLEVYRWVGYVGLAIILWVSGQMIWEGWGDLALTWT